MTVNKHKQSKSVADESESTLSDEIRLWLLFLSSLINVEQKVASNCYQLFFNREFECCIDHRQFIRKMVSHVMYPSCIFYVWSVGVLYFFLDAISAVTPTLPKLFIENY